MDTTDLSSWRRLGDIIRTARIELGYTNRETFADVCNVSARVLADIEAGTRSNFSDRVLGGIEEALGWPSGTIDQIIADSNFEAPAPVGGPGGEGGGLIFRPPNFNRRPVLVDVAAVERSIATLTETRKKHESSALSRTENQLATALIAQCWPYVTRLVEDNCLPGRELHPAVRPLYETFTQVSDWLNPADPAAKYVRWLSGDDTDVTDTIQQRYMQRWLESRRTAKGRKTQETEAETAAQR